MPSGAETDSREAWIAVSGKPAGEWARRADGRFQLVSSVSWESPGKTEQFADSEDLIDGLLAIEGTLFNAIADRPWRGAYFMRDTGGQPNGLRLYERLGQQTVRLDLTTRKRLHAVLAIIGFVVGTAADMGQQPPREVLDGEIDRDELIARYADQWRTLDPAESFVLHFVDDFAHHDDADHSKPPGPHPSRPPTGPHLTSATH